MFAAVLSGGVRGVSSYLMRVEVDAADGLPSFVMVGYVSSDTREAGERVRVALKNAGYSLPPMRITVNLSPAAIRKECVSIDLPLAMGLLIAMGELDEDVLKDTIVLGELGLDGEIRRIRGKRERTPGRSFGTAPEIAASRLLAGRSQAASTSHNPTPWASNAATRSR